MTRLIFLITVFIGFSCSAQQKVISVADKLISISGRKLEVNGDGFPKQIQSYYDSEFRKFGFKPTNLLYEPIHFHFFTSPKTKEKLVINSFEIIAEHMDSIVWNATSSSNNLSQDVRAKMSSDGYVNFHVKLKALKNVALSMINFHIPFDKNAAKYLVGLGSDGYLRPDTVKWNWKTVNHLIPEVLIGNDNAALYFSIDQTKVSKNPLVQNGWRNDDKGTMQINIKGSSMLTEFSSGSISLNEGDELVFDFSLFITPLNRKDAKRNLNKRFKFYSNEDADRMKSRH